MFSGLERPSHWLVLAVIVVLLFGYKKLPDAARSVGRSLRIFKTEIKGMNEDDAARAAATPETPKPPAAATPVVPAPVVETPAQAPVAPAPVLQPPVAQAPVAQPPVVQPQAPAEGTASANPSVPNV